MDRIADAGAGFRSVTENIDTTTPAGRYHRPQVRRRHGTALQCQSANRLTHRRPASDGSAIGVRPPRRKPEEPPVSVPKKPPRKAASTSSRPKAAVADGALPDRRAMESYLAAIAGQGRDDAIAKAQDIMTTLGTAPTSRSRITLARKALADPAALRRCLQSPGRGGRVVEEARDLYAGGSRPGSWRSGPKGSRNMGGISGVPRDPSLHCEPGEASPSPSSNSATRAPPSSTSAPC